MTTISESGEPLILSEECRQCGHNPAEGLSWFDETNGWHFKCDECGKVMFLGYAEDDNQAMVDAKRAYERALENRSRFIREKDEQMQQVYRDARENLQREPDVVKAYSFLFDPAAAVKGKEWQSDLNARDDRPADPFTRHVPQL